MNYLKQLHLLLFFTSFCISTVEGKNTYSHQSDPDQMTIHFTGISNGKKSFQNAQLLFTNRTYVLENVPVAFEGFEFMNSGGNEVVISEITASAAGTVYIIAPIMTLSGWAPVEDTEFNYDDPALTKLRIYEKAVSMGDKIKLPVTNKFVAARPLAKQIDIYVPDGNDSLELKPLKSANSSGVGPLNLPYFRDAVLGTAFVYDQEYPDLFILGRGKTANLYLHKWLRNQSDGTPIFGKGQIVQSPYLNKGTIFQTPDKQIHGVWIVRDTLLVHTVFDSLAMAFNHIDQIRLPALPNAPQNVGVFPNDGGSVDVVLEVRGYRIPGKYPGQNSSTVDWRPYDHAGISSSPFQYEYLYSFHLPQLLGGTPTNIKQASTTNKEVYFSMQSFSSVDLGDNDQDNLICGSRVGSFSYYKRKNDDILTFEERRYFVDEDGIIIRHPSINPSICSYKGKEEEFSNVIAGGEGAVYFYKFTGNFTTDGSPIFTAPREVLQEDADIFLGTLPTPSVVDWDGDGVLDMIVGNSEGFILFSKNIGTNAQPNFLPGTRISAGGKEIHVQAGYTSVQGTPESRWGYVSPTIYDWNDDGLLDIITGDIKGNYEIYINKGTVTNANLDSAHPLYCEGIELHGMWRSSPAIAKFGEKTAMVIIDGNDNFHVYWRLDDYNVEDGGKILLSNDAPIYASADPGGGTGRCKLSFFDYDNDGKLDVIIGTGFRSAIPDTVSGYPRPLLGNNTMGTPLFMKNVGTGANIVLEKPQAFFHTVAGLVQPGGIHESGAVATTIGGGNERNLLVTDETGRFFILQGNHLFLLNDSEATLFKNNPNPFPGFP